jgi:hypothetical protein
MKPRSFSLPRNADNRYAKWQAVPFSQFASLLKSFVRAGLIEAG